MWITVRVDRATRFKYNGGMRKITAILAALTVLTICSCGAPPGYVGGDHDSALSSVPATISDNRAGELRPFEANEQESDGVETAKRKIVKKGSIRFATTDVNETQSLITQTVQELNGYIANFNADSHSNRLEHRLTIRVPANQFDSLVNTVSRSVNKFDSKVIEALDVTEEYVDIEARTKTKKELQNRYIALLERAETIEEILRIEREIGSLQTEIETVEGRMRYLRDRVAFSTLNVTYYQEIDVPEIDIPAVPFGFFSKFAEGIKSGWEGFLWFIIGLSYLWVFLLLAVMIYFVRLWGKKKKAW